MDPPGPSGRSSYSGAALSLSLVTTHSRAAQLSRKLRGGRKFLQSVLGRQDLRVLSTLALSHVGHMSLMGRSKLRNTRLPRRARSNDFGNPRRRATDVLLTLNVAVFAAQIASRQALTGWGSKENQLIAAGQWWRLLTPVFLHANIVHLVMNNYALNNLGPLTEAFNGHRRFLALYSTSALTGSITSFLASPRAAVGASGAIFGVGGAMAVFFIRHRDAFGPASKSILQSLAQSLLLNVAFGLTSSQIDNWGHLGGLAGGAIFAYLFGPRWIMDSKLGQLVDRPLIALPAPSQPS